jgi:hypothetical protein
MERLQEKTASVVHFFTGVAGAEVTFQLAELAEHVTGKAGDSGDVSVDWA